MDDHSDSKRSEAAENSVSTPPVGHDTKAAFRPNLNASSSGRKNRSAVWNHFTTEPDSVKKAKCNYCGCLIKYAHGTSAMNAHFNRCKACPDIEESKRQKIVTPTSPKTEGHAGGLGSSPNVFKFDQEAGRSALVKMFVLEGLPFRFVESEGFRNLVNVVQPRFKVPSCIALVRDIITLHHVEKKKLEKYLSTHCRKVCLIIDTWASSQKLNYMSLTAQFIDNDWKLHKKILNFCQVTSHSTEIMEKSVEFCLNKWQLIEVFSLTVDNMSSTDLAIRYLKSRMISLNSIILKGGYTHVCCYAHILSLIVKEGLKEIENSILRIRGAVKYIRSSPSRLNRFKWCVEKDYIDYESLVCLDVESRWSSTYLMLEAALKHKKAFESLKRDKCKYVDELSRENGKGVPSEDDWEFARSILPFLKLFYDSAVRVSSTSCITCDIYMKEVFGIGRKICCYCEDNNVSIRLMASKVKNIYDKYWGDSNVINMLLLIAVVLDPRMKLDYVNWSIDYIFGSEKGCELKLKLSSYLGSLYNFYQGTGKRSQDDQQVAKLEDEDDLYSMRFYLQSTGRKSDVKSELDRYLKEDCESYNKSIEFDILSWWKLNSIRFPVLANMAREMLAIPITTITSKSAFSIGGRVLDPYYNSLTPNMVEALVCTQDWLNGEPFSLLAPENFEEIEKIEREMVSAPYGAWPEASLDD